MAEMTGKVKWFDKNKGHGFIEQRSGEPDAFVHYADIDQCGFRNLQEGQAVEYTVVDTPRGPKATNVRVIE